MKGEQKQASHETGWERGIWRHLISQEKSVGVRNERELSSLQKALGANRYLCQPSQLL